MIKSSHKHKKTTTFYRLCLKNRRIFATVVRDYSWLFVTIRDYSEFSQTPIPPLHHAELSFLVSHIHTLPYLQSQWRSVKLRRKKCSCNNRGWILPASCTITTVTLLTILPLHLSFLTACLLIMIWCFCDFVLTICLMLH